MAMRRKATPAVPFQHVVTFHHSARAAVPPPVPPRPVGGHDVIHVTVGNVKSGVRRKSALPVEPLEPLNAPRKKSTSPKVSRCSEQDENAFLPQCADCAVTDDDGLSRPGPSSPPIASLADTVFPGATSTTSAKRKTNSNRVDTELKPNELLCWNGEALDTAVLKLRVSKHKAPVTFVVPYVRAR